MINADAIGAMKRGVRVINLARGEIVDDEAMLAALDTGKVAAYITDFPNNRLLAAPHVIALPHLGASTPEKMCIRDRWYPHAAHVGRSLIGVLLPYCLLLSLAVFLLYLGGQLVMQIQ